MSVFHKSNHNLILLLLQEKDTKGEFWTLGTNNNVWQGKEHEWQEDIVIKGNNSFPSEKGVDFVYFWLSISKSDSRIVLPKGLCVQHDDA